MKYLKLYENYEKEYTISGEGTDIFNYILENELENIQKYIDAGGNMNEECCGSVPIYYSVQNGTYKTTEAILKSPDVDVDYDVGNGSVALAYAAKQQKKKTIELLLDYGAKTDIYDHFNMSILQKATSYNIQDMLIDAGADWNNKSNWGGDFYQDQDEERQKELREKYPDEYDNYIMKINTKKYMI